MNINSDNVNWLDVYETDDDDIWAVDPQDGEGFIIYWWDDMRPREVRQLVIEVYERALRIANKNHKG